MYDEFRSAVAKSVVTAAPERNDEGDGTEEDGMGTFGGNSILEEGSGVVGEGNENGECVADHMPAEDV